MKLNCGRLGELSLFGQGMEMGTLIIEGDLLMPLPGPVVEGTPLKLVNIAMDMRRLSRHGGIIFTHCYQRTVKVFLAKVGM